MEPVIVSGPARACVCDSTVVVAFSTRKCIANNQNSWKDLEAMIAFGMECGKSASFPIRPNQTSADESNRGARGSRHSVSMSRYMPPN